MFEVIIWIGAAISLIGLIGIIYCIVRVAKARRAGLQDDALRVVLHSVIPVNMGALFLSVIGLMMVVVGIFLG